MRLLFFCLALLTSFLGFSQIQNLEIIQQPIEQHLTCGLSKDIIMKGTETPFLSPSLYPPECQFTCGKFKIYYADFLPGAPAVGFADPNIGNVRRNTLCAVLTYVQTVFDFSNVLSSNPIRIEVEASFASNGNSAPTSVGYFAYAGPSINFTTPNKIEGGNVFDYITTGSNNADASGFHAFMKVNFDQVYTNGNPQGININWLNDHTQNVSNCQIDLFSVLLHEVGHTLGFLSFANNNGTLDPNSFSNNNNFSRLDFLLHKSNNLTATGLQKFIFGSLSNAYMNSAFINAPINDNKFWSSGNNAPNNIPIYSGAYNPSDLGNPPSFLSHLDDQSLSYDYRARNSPGFEDDYVMGPFGFNGLMRRNFTDTEIKIFIGMGYTLNSTYINPNLYNLPPYSKKMGNAVGYETNMEFVETVIQDAQIVNNIGNTYVYNLWQDNGINGIMDPEGQTLMVADGSLTNIRGCGNGGNNHAQLTLSADKRTITFTPRANFIGRAQFAFKLFDGVKVGSWHFVTIDVTTGTNVNYPIGSNLLINGNCEEGTEVRRTIAPDLTKPLASFDKSYRPGFLHGQHLSDASPYCIYGNYWVPYAGGDYIKYSWQDCNPDIFGSFGNSIHSQTSPGGYISEPFPWNNQGDRYRKLGNQNWFGLGKSLTSCQNYILKLDYRLTPNLPFLAINTNFIFGFSNSINLVANNLTNASINPNLNYWTHIEIPFTYCSQTNASFLWIDNNPRILVDNMEIVEVPNPSPISLTVSGINYICSGESTTLTANVTNPLCNVTYLWSNGSTSSTITISPSTTTTYTVTINNGCQSISASKTITVISTSFTACCSPANFTNNAPINTSTMPSIPNGSTIQVNGDIIVNSNISLSGCTLRLAPGVKITVNAGFNLSLSNCSLYSCSEMWKGIIVLPGGILNMSGTRIEDALEAVSSSYVGGFTTNLNINNCTFNKNKTGIYLQGFTNMPNILNGINSTFDCTATGSPTSNSYLKAPYASQKSHYGIHLFKVTGLTVGGATLPNIFQNLEVGIYVQQGDNIGIVKNNFTNINSLCPVANACNTTSFKGWGIYAEDVGNITIGNSTNTVLGNSFTNSYNGISLINTPKFAIYRNTFNNIKNLPVWNGSTFEDLSETYCISIKNYNGISPNINYIQNNTLANIEYGIYYNAFKSSTLNINQNQFSNFNSKNAVAIYLLENPIQSIIVNGNVFNQLASETGIYAIRIQNAMSQLGSGASVSANRINNVQTGIWLTNYSNSSILNHNTTTMSFGSIPSGIFYPTGLPSVASYGIYIQNCQNTTVRNNFIQKAAPDPTNTYTTRLYGIFADMGCMNSIIQDNNVQRLGTGIQIQGLTNNPLQLKCNFMSSNMSGLTINSSIIGNQGTSTNPQDNQWASLPTAMFSGGALYARQPGTVNTIYFYARSNTLPMFPPTTGMNPSTSISYWNSGSLTYNCAVSCSGSGCPQAAMGMIANKEGEYSSLTEEETKILDVEVYKILKKNVDYYDPTTIDGMEIATYLDSLESTNAGKIYRFEEKVIEKDTLGAFSEIYGVIPSTDIEQNFKVVNDIYWRTWFIGVYSFTPQDSSALYDIAYQDPSYGGTAVFTARVMLGIDVESNSTKRSSNSISTSNLIETKFVHFFPNPAKDYVNYEVYLEMNEFAQLEVFDLFGRIIFSKKIDYDTKTGYIDFKSKSATVYTYKVRLKNKVVTGKLVVE